VKHRIMILCLASVLIALTGSCQAGGTNRESDSAATSNAAPKAVNKPDRKVVVDEVRAVLVAHDKALSEKNIDAVMATFSTEPTTVVLGTGSEERWMGPQEIKSAYTEIFKDYDPNTLQTDCQWKTGGGDDAGTMAWLAASCDAKDSLQGKTRSYKLNVTATLEKQNDSWRFVSLHMSNAFQPPVTK
jgi:ketosteroid isomerase-like protein